MDPQPNILLIIADDHRYGAIRALTTLVRRLVTASALVIPTVAVGDRLAFELADLDGRTGFALNGVATGDESGYPASAAGDVNGDGFDDLLIGAFGADSNGKNSGASYVVFGDGGVGSSGVIELSTLDGTNGFVLNGVSAGDESGGAVSAAGDVNGDGVDDLLIGAEEAGFSLYAGAGYVVFGGNGVGSGGVFELSALDGTNGFVLNGVGPDHLAGYTVSVAGDVNDDGLDDLIIGAHGAEPNGGSSGASYVVFGAPGVGISGALELSALDGTNGFVLNGAAPYDRSGFSVAASGDANGDGIDDLLIGAHKADPNGDGSGASFLVFGGAGLGQSGVLELSSLDGTNGFVLNGVAPGDAAGLSVSVAGDVNGDGVDDVVIGAFQADPNGDDAGASYVVFGAAGLGAGGALELAALDGTDGFVVNGVAAADQSGSSVSGAGDVNGDGVDDLLIGAYKANPNGEESGASYVVFGGAGVGGSGTVELSSLDGANGFVLNGVHGGDESGCAVSGAGDVNGDGVDDLIIGASGAEPNGEDSGAAYVVFGRAGVGSSGAVELSSLDGTNGLVLNGVLSHEERHPRGISVSAAGDVNDDGLDDLVMGNPRAIANGVLDAGVSYVVFGGTEIGGSGALELSALDGTNGFALNGVAPGDRAGFAVSGAGDVNGDGVDDLVIGAALADPNGRLFSGVSYVVFGGAGLGGNGAHDLSTLDGTNGFVLNGVAADDRTGLSVSGAGDVNDDGVDDLLIGAYRADPGGRPNAGSSYVVFGDAGLGSSGALELSALDGTNGFVLNGVAPGDLTGLSVSGPGDVNGDGVDDLLIGAKWADPSGADSGAGYVVYGGAGLGRRGALDLSALDGTNGFVLNGVAAGDRAGRWVSGAGDVNGDGVADLLIGAYEADPAGRLHAGASYVVFGRRPGPGATLTSAAGARVTCANLTTRRNVVIPLETDAAWDCGWNGLSVQSDDRVAMFFDGVALGTAQFGGKAIGFDAGPAITRCENVRTGQSVVTYQSGQAAWDCRTAGLEMTAGDAVRLVVVGRAD